MILAGCSIFSNSCSPSDFHEPLSLWLWFVQAATYLSIISLNWFNYLITARLNPPSKFRHSNRLPNQSKKVCIIHHNLSHLNVADNNHRWCLQWAGKNMPLITSNYHITCRQQRTAMTRAASTQMRGPWEIRALGAIFRKWKLSSLSLLFPVHT